MIDRDESAADGEEPRCPALSEQTADNLHVDPWMSFLLRYIYDTTRQNTIDGSTTAHTYTMTVSAQETITPHHRFLYKPVAKCETNGCHIDVWLPENVEALSGDAGIPLAGNCRRRWQIIPS